VGEEPNQEDQAPAARSGEAAWRANLERIAERNAKAKKEGKQQREAYERRKDDARRLHELRELERNARRGGSS
jgi:hypothetical protein